MAKYPLLFGFRDVVSGKGFWAGVAADGCALLVEEGEKDHWMYGVQPGGVAGGGPSQDEAYLDFRKGYRSVLFDIADEAQDFASFKREVETFFNEVNRETEAEWRAAVARVRAGELDLDWLPKKKVDQAPCRIEVVEIQPEAQDSAVARSVVNIPEDATKQLAA